MWARCYHYVIVDRNPRGVLGARVGGGGGGGGGGGESDRMELLLGAGRRWREIVPGIFFLLINVYI